MAVNKEQLLIVIFALLACVACRLVRFSYVGCYVDYTGGVRDLNGLSRVSQLGSFGVTDGIVSSSSMSHELCSSVCSLGGFAYFGVQVGDQCLCGSSFGSQGKASESDCGMQCTGNSLQKCGAQFRNSVFALSYPNNNTYTVVNQPSLTVITSTASSWPIAAQSAIECAAQCSAKVDCQATVFSQRLLACHLLEFAYPPASLSGPEWTLFMRG